MNDAAKILAGCVEALPDAAFALDVDERVLCANRSARQLFVGLRDGDAISRTVRAPEILDAIRESVRASPVTRIWLTRVPVERQFDVHVAALGSDVAGAILVTLRDTSETRRIERMRVDFVANASHELRTPLASLLGFVETLQGPARDDPAARDRFLAIMGEQARRMSRLVDDLLSLSRIEQSLHMRPNDSVDLASVAAHMTDALAPMAEDRDVMVTLDSPEPVYVRGDRDELLRVVENLVENAIKYGGPGTVALTVVRDGGSGILSVADQGPGIAPEHIPRPHRTVLPHRCGCQSRQRWDWARACYRQAYRRPPPWPSVGRLKAWTRHAFFGGPTLVQIRTMSTSIGVTKLLRHCHTTVGDSP